MSKVYDRVEWLFLETMTSRMGFHNQWIKLIMNSVSIVSYYILINGAPQPSFKPTRDIRKGNPLSPYLFILCVEALSCLLNIAEVTGCLSNVTIGRGPMHINHLFFVDNSLLFCKANSLEWSEMIYVMSLIYV